MRSAVVTAHLLRRIVVMLVHVFEMIGMVSRVRSMITLRNAGYCRKAQTAKAGKV